MFLETVLLSKCLCVLERCFPPFLSSILLISFSLGLPVTQGIFLFLHLRDILSFYFVWLSMSVYMNYEKKNSSLPVLKKCPYVEVASVQTICARWFGQARKSGVGA